MNFGEGVPTEQYNEKGFVPKSEEQTEYSEEQTEADKLYKQELRDLDAWRNNLLQKCEADECVGKKCEALRQVIEDEYVEKKLELHHRAHYVEHSM